MSKPVKILHVVFSLEPGGMENGVVNVAGALKPAEFDVHVCCLERPGAFVERLPEPNKVYVLHKPRGFHFSAVLKLTKLIRQLKPDVLHSHNLGPLMYSGLASGFGTLAPILHGEHSLLTDDECTPRRVRQRRIFYRACKKVHTVSDGLREQLLNLGLPSERIVALLNGVDTVRFSPGDKGAARRELKLPENGLMLGVVGRFGPFKRHAMLINAFEKLAQQHPDIHLLVVGGSGPEKDKIYQQAQSSTAKDRIHLAGFQNNLPPFYRAMDVLVVPSINEGLSNAVLEAMACGVPVLANNTCGNGEVIRSSDEGIVTDLNSEEKLRCELERVIAERSRLAAMGTRARESVIKSFSIDTMVYNYQRLYRQAAGREAMKKQI
jgi:glycosyltransferase involved in cell wall biosynthesis